MSGVLLDTCALLRIAGGIPISLAATRAIQDAVLSREVFVSAVTAWEVANLHRRGRMRLSPPFTTVEGWFASLMGKPGFAPLPLHLEVALASTALPELDHRDPADRFLLATARHLNIPLITSDRVLLRYAETGHAQCIPC